MSRWAVVALLAAQSLAAQQPTRRDTTVQLPPIAVTVTRASAPLGSLPAAVTVLRDSAITTADLGLSLASALAAVPGVVAQDRGNASRDASVAIRGFGARAAFGVRGIRILLDGIPQTMPDGQSQLTLVNLRRVAEIEVLRGTASALHGNATGGVISLVSDHTVPAHPRGDAEAAAGSYGLQTVDLGGRFPLAGGYVDASAQRDAATGYRRQARYEVWRGHAGTRFAIGGVGTLGWLFDAATYPEAQDPGALTADEMAADRRQANPRYVAVDAGKAVWQAQTGLTLERPLGAAGHLASAAFVTRRSLDNQLPFALIDLERWAYGGRVVTTLPLDRRGRATVVGGADLQWLRDDRVNRTADGTAVTRDQLETVSEVGPFVQLRLVPVDRVSVLAGARYDLVGFGVTDRLLADGDASGSRTMQAPSGMLGVSLQLSAPLVAWARIGTAFETPTTTELANRPDGGGGFNPDLDPQHAVELEVGTRITTSRLEASAALFRADVRDELISFEVPSDPGRAYFRNAGRARHQGVELDGRLAGPGGSWVAAAYTLSDLRFTDYATADARYDGNRIPGVPLHLGRGAVGVPLGPVQLQAEVRAASHLFVNDQNSATADGWWVADLEARASLRAGGWSLRPYVGLENLFDEHYVGAVVVNATAGRYYEPAPTRTVYAGLAVRGASAAETVRR